VTKINPLSSTQTPQNFQPESDPKVRDQQTPVGVVELAQVSTAPFFPIEIKEHICQALKDISTAEKVSLKVLTSRLLMHMLIYHKNEVCELIRQMKCPEAW
jgi:hypothetical protein